LEGRGYKKSRIAAALDGQTGFNGLGFTVWGLGIMLWKILNQQHCDTQMNISYDWL